MQIANSAASDKVTLASRMRSGHDGGARIHASAVTVKM